MANWNTDAQFVHVLSEDWIFVNNRIESFLRENKVFLVVASKGMGKTLLLRYKRSQLENDNMGVTVVPQDNSADYVQLPASLALEKLTLLREYEFWRDVWEISIALSALVHFPHNLSRNDIAHVRRVVDRLPLPGELRDTLVASIHGEWHPQLEPSDALNIILQGSHKSILKIRNACLHPLFDLFREYITSGMALFIDSFDQALSDRYPDDITLWMSGQHGLLKAAWEMSRQNAHVKVYAAIRQEAWSAFRGPEKGNMYGSTLLIEYSPRDLAAIMQKAVKYYEGIPSIDEFAGLKSVRNDRVGVEESPFGYILRHSLGVPRWLMVIGEEIANARAATIPGSDWNDEFRQVVNRTASLRLAKPYLDSDMRLFMDHGYGVQFSREFLRLLNSNVLTYGSVRRICDRFNENFEDGIHRHPFCALYNLGLLGIVINKPDSNSRVQYFRKPYEFEGQLVEVIPAHPAGLYLLHPALNALIREHNAEYTLHNVLIGDGLPWTETDDEIIHGSQIRIFISYAHEDHLIAEETVRYLENRFNESSYIYDLWFDKDKMLGGKVIRDQIEQGLSDCDYMLLLLSKHSVRSEFVRMEWQTRLQHDRSRKINTLLPVIVDDLPAPSIPRELEKIYCYNFCACRNRQQELQRVYEDIKFMQTDPLLHECRGSLVG